MDRQNKTDTRVEKRNRLLTGTILLLGLWGMGRGLLSVAGLAAALAAMSVTALADWRKRWQGFALTAAGGCALALGFFCREGIASHLAHLGSLLARTLTAQTGYYFHSFENPGATAEGAVAVGLLLGLAVACLVRAGNPVAAPLGTALVLARWSLGIVQEDLWLAVYLLGILLLLAKTAGGKGLFWTAGIALALGGCVMAVCSLAGFQPEVSSRLEETIHQWRYEEEGDPLPEGELSGVGRFAPSDDAALEITMDHWETVFLRGFVGSRYTGSGWEEESGQVLSDSADLLYTLQKRYFHPFEQLSAANRSLGTEPDNTITVKVLGACRAYSYLPYGVGGLNLDCRDLTEPEISGYTGTLCAVDEAYLRQKELSDGAGTTDYLDAEHAYRDWVYEHYLDLPEDTVPLLERKQDLTTTEAKERVLAWLDETLTYDENATTRAGDTDLARYLIEVSPYGCSVHYATLGTLAMRSLGIPARYVEGYIVPQSVAGTMGAGETLLLTQEYAHAWVEYYLDGIGWIPFEVTPGYETELVYRLPPDGTGAHSQEEIQETQPPEKPPVKQELDPGSQTKLHSVQVLQNVLLLLLVLAVLAFVLRAVLLRRKLRQRLARFREDDSREALLDCLGYQYELLKTMGLRERNVPLLQRKWDISQVLFGEDVTPILLTAQELSFSHHPVREEQRQQVLAALDRVRKIWKQKTPLRKRIYQKWVRCRVL